MKMNVLIADRAVQIDRDRDEAEGNTGRLELPWHGSV